MAAKYFRAKHLTVMQQVLRMKALHPQFSVSATAFRAAWTGEVTPSALSETYVVRVTYEPGRHPRTSVLSPKLRRREDGRPIPHTYAGDFLCLYFPRAREWRADKFIADTIIPWISLWLFYYEGWLATGEWLGGGIDHGGGEKDPA
jgi:hypothetical protein